MTDVFLTVLNMSLTAGFLVLAVLLLRLLLRRAPKWINLLLWGLVAVRLLCPVTFESNLSLVPDSRPMDNVVGIVTPPSTPSAPSSPSVDTDTSAVTIPDGEGTGSLAPTPGDSVDPIQIVAAVAANVWVLGMLVMAVYAVVSYAKIKRQVREAIPGEGNIRLCERLATSFILGVIKPKIYLPATLDGEDAAYVIAHEQAHLKRGDHLWKPLGYLLLTVHWFNPLLWVAYILLCRDIELACDEKVLAGLGKERKKDYATALVNCSVPRRQIAACPLAFGEVSVKKRVLGVLSYKKPAFWVVLAAVLACAVAAVCLLTTRPGNKSDKPTEEDAAFVATLGTDVRYTLTDMDGDGTAELLTEDNLTLSVYDRDGYRLLSTYNFASGTTRYLHTGSEDVPGLFIFMAGGGLEHYNHLTRRNGQLVMEELWADNYSGLYDIKPEDLIYTDNETLIRLSKKAYQENDDVVWHTLKTASTDLSYSPPSEYTAWFTAWPEQDMTTQIPPFPGVTFTYNREEARIEATEGGITIPLVYSPTAAYFCDVTGDDKPELCVNTSFGSGIVDDYVFIFDYVTKESYEIRHRCTTNYQLTAKDNLLWVQQAPYPAEADTDLAYMSDDILTAGKVPVTALGLTTFYRSLITQYSNAYYAEDLPEDTPVNSTMLSLLRTFGGTLHYALYDINGDGVEELVILQNTNYTTYEPEVIDLYTKDGNRAVSLLSGFETDFGERNHLYILPDNRLVAVKANGSYYTVAEEYRLEGATLVAEEKYGYCASQKDAIEDYTSMTNTAFTKKLEQAKGQAVHHTLTLQEIVSADPIDPYKSRYAYTNEQGDGATLLLNDSKKTFQLSLSYYSSYLPHGSYTEEKDILTLSADDGKHTYVFRREGDNLIFLASKSSSMPKYSYGTGQSAQVCVPDGAVFTPDGENPTSTYTPPADAIAIDGTYFILYVPKAWEGLYTVKKVTKTKMTLNWSLPKSKPGCRWSPTSYPAITTTPMCRVPASTSYPPTATCSVTTNRRLAMKIIRPCWTPVTK